MPTTYIPILATFPIVNGFSAWDDFLADLAECGESPTTEVEVARSTTEVVVSMLITEWRYLRERIDCEYLSYADGAYAAVVSKYPKFAGCRIVAVVDGVNVTKDNLTVMGLA